MNDLGMDGIYRELKLNSNLAREEVEREAVEDKENIVTLNDEEAKLKKI